MAGGAAKFLVNYKPQDGVDAEPTLMTTDGTIVKMQEVSKHLNNLPAIQELSEPSTGRA